MAYGIWGRTAWGKGVVGADWIPRLKSDRCPCRPEWDGGERAFGESDQKQLLLNKASRSDWARVAFNITCRQSLSAFKREAFVVKGAGLPIVYDSGSCEVFRGDNGLRNPHAHTHIADSGVLLSNARSSCRRP